MALALDELEREALSLPAEIRLHLAEKLFSSISTIASPEIDSAWYAEVDRRFQTLESGTIVTRNVYECLSKTELI